MNEIRNFCANIKNEVTRIFFKALGDPEPIRLMYTYISDHTIEQRHVDIYRPLQ
jgi:hypothetical protein